MMKQIQANKRGQVGLDTAKAVMLTLLIVAVIAFTAIIMLVNLSDTNVAKESGSISVFNETGVTINDTNLLVYTIAEANRPDFNTFAVSQVRDSTGTLVAAENYTLGSNGTITNTTIDAFEDAQIDYSFRYNTFSDTERNISTGLVNFFANATTWFALLSVVIIILIIAIVIFAVNRFGGNQVRL